MDESINSVQDIPVLEKPAPIEIIDSVGAENIDQEKLKGDKFDESNIQQEEMEVPEVELASEGVINDAHEILKSEERDTVTVAFLDLSGAPIVNLNCKISNNGCTSNMLTDHNGELVIEKMNFKVDASIQVQKLNGSYKEIYKDIIPIETSRLLLVSPKILFETQTLEHKGPPGDAAGKIPKPSKPQARVEVKTKKTTSSGNQSISKPQPKIAGAPARKLELEPLRDNKGMPHAVVTDKSYDWWGRWRMGMLNWWDTKDFNSNKASEGTKRAIPSKATPDKDQLERLNTLISISEEQAELSIGQSTIEALAKMSKGTFKADVKAKNEAKGWCAKYVKLALMRSGIVKEGILNFDAASEGSAALIKAGFSDITSQLPDPRWAAPGDVIIYRWNSVTFTKRKKSSRWGGSKEKPNNSLRNYGHIDIRTYNSYISDFENNRYPCGKYDLVGVYRSKFFDLMPLFRMTAFLKVIREFECHEQSDDKKRYFILQNPINGIRSFNKTSTHPYTDSASKNGSFSGAYQIHFNTWKDLTEKYELPKSFTPEVQDRMAICLIENRGALGLIRSGNIENAVKLLFKEWSSLPGGVHTRKFDRTQVAYTIDDLLKLYEKFLKELKG